jgi:phosphate-selective porin OprO/OprP
VIGRGTFAPLYQQTPDGTMVLHLGVNSRFRDNGGGDQSATNTTAGSNFSYKSRTPGDAISTTGGDQAFSVGGTGQDFTYGFEAAFQYNNFGIEAEYQHLDTQGATNGGSTGLGSNDDASADGYYVDLFWSPTGESRSYKAADGSFGAIAPLRPLGSGGFGHVMLAARYEHVDFTDEQFGGTSGDVNGAVNPAGMTGRTEATSYTLGASWVPIEHVKFQLNYASTSIDDIGVGVADQDVNTISLRTQLDW